MFDFDSNFDAEKILKNHGLDESGKVQEYITNAVMDMSEPYVPFDIAGKYAHPGKLRDSAHIENGTDVVWIAPYARRWYYEKANFQGAPMRGNHWVDRMLQNGGRKEIEDGARRIANQ